MPTKTKKLTKKDIAELLASDVDLTRSIIEKIRLQDREIQGVFKNKKARLAWDYLHNDITEEILFGGAASGGKSVLLINWAIDNCQRFKGSRGVVGRETLARLEESTLNTFFEVCTRRNLKRDVDYKYNAVKHIITFNNGSEIYLKDLVYQPRDPNYDDLGSTEFTWVAVDECNQIEEKCWSVLKSRIRYKLDHYCHYCGQLNKQNIPLEFNEHGSPIKWKCKKCGTVTKGLTPKILGTCNPAKNWVYSRFYKPWKEGTLDSTLQFIPALITDNPYALQSNIEVLKRSDEATKQRLLYGNWEYDDDDSKLLDIDDIYAIFDNSDALEGEMYISADIALQGSDLCVIGVWNGFILEKIETRSKHNAQEIENIVRNLATQYGVPQTHIIYDNDGVGAFLGSYLKTAIPFKNSGKCIGAENYMNLKSQCYFKLVEKIGEIWIKDKSVNNKKSWNKSIKELIVEDLEQLKRKDIDKDGKLAIIPKERIKKILGRSPDFSDMLMMRMYFELKHKVKKKGFTNLMINI